MKTAQKSLIRRLATLVGVRRSLVEDLLNAQAALVIEDLMNGRPATLPGLGRIKIRRRKNSFSWEGKRAVLRPSRPLAVALQQLEQVFD
jgi:nucleoid DNA-binding protein